MAATEILLLRHAEKPDDAASGPGLTPDGREGRRGKSPGTQVQHAVADGTRATEFRHF
jgi:hypothetical protein